MGIQYRFLSSPHVPQVQSRFVIIAHMPALTYDVLVLDVVGGDGLFPVDGESISSVVHDA